MFFRKISWALALLIVCAVFPLASLGSSKTVVVNCNEGESINQALKHPADELIIEIHGMCTQDVVVNRDYVTLLGTDPETDGIIAATKSVPEPPTADDRYWDATALQVREARHVKIQNLTLSEGGWSGLRLVDSRRGVQVINCRLTNNRNGAILEDSQMEVSDTLFSDNTRTGAAVTANGRLDCTNCTFEGNETGISMSGASVATFADSVISGATEYSLLISGSSVVVFLRGAIHGGASSGLNWVTRGSYLEVRDGTELYGKTTMTLFGNGLFESTQGHAEVSCQRGGDLFCDHASILSSNCSLCPKP